MGTSNRPLSPHLQVYRWQITMVLSILHRFSGVFLSIGSIVLAWWLIAAALGADHFATMAGLLASPFGKLALFGWTAAFYFHLANGIRHLFWDIGWGFEISEIYLTGWSVLVISTLLTVVTWLPQLRDFL
ncbi:MAG: succinate dehydrogenase, cytochrome b556 subunit [Gammaproteobacteria bacterium]